MRGAADRLCEPPPAAMARAAGWGFAAAHNPTKRGLRLVIFGAYPTERSPPPDRPDATRRSEVLRRGICASRQRFTWLILRGAENGDDHPWQWRQSFRV